MGTYIVGAILIIGIILAVYSLIKQKKSGKSISCGGNCSACGVNCPNRKESQKQ